MRTHRTRLAAFLFHAAALGLFALAAFHEPGLRPIAALWGLGLFGHGLYIWVLSAPKDDAHARLLAQVEVERALQQAKAQSVRPRTTRSRLPRS